MARQVMEGGDTSKSSGASDKMPYGQNDNLNKDVSKSIDEVNSARTSMTPQQYNQFLKQSVSQLFNDEDLIPKLALDSASDEDSGKMPMRMLNESEVQKMVGIGTMQLISSNSSNPV
jgi:hypothetical protein